jgi:hypothetical protein
MKRLRENLEDSEPSVRAGAALLSKVRPFELSPDQRRRIRARVEAEPEGRGARWLRPAFALPLLLIVGIAGASAGERWYRAATTQRPLEKAPLPATPHAPSVVRAAPAARPAALPEVSVDVEAPPEVEAEVKPAPTAKASPSGPGASLMMEALQARRAGDAARAQQLSAEYRKKYPSGALREEALAIAFESAAARSDPSAAKLAQNYLASFPRGRFRKQAEQVLASQR